MQRSTVNYLKTYCKEYGTGQANGMFGELMQGVLQNNRHFLVTLPIEKYSYVKFMPSSSLDHVKGIPSFKYKSIKLTEMILKEYSLPLGGILEINTDLPIGKGLASSTADLVATARAIENCFNIEITNKNLEKFLRMIEPSDGVIYSEIVSYYHKEVMLKEHIGLCPYLTVVGHDEGGVVDTVKFNEIHENYTDKTKKKYDELLNKLKRAVKNFDLKAIGEVSTASALIHQKYQPKSTLEKMIKINQSIGGLGIIIAHSGTYIGILLAPNEKDYNDKLEKASNLISEFGFNTSIFNTKKSI